MDVIWATAVASSLFDPTVSAALVARHLRWALDSGDPLRVARALANEAVWLAGMGGRMARRSASLLERADTLVRHAGGDFEQAWVRMGRGLVAWMRGRFPESVSELRGALDIYRASCRGASYEVGLTNLFLLSGLALCGETDELERRTLEERADAIERGDLFALQSTILGQQCVAWLLRDRAEVVEVEAVRALEPLAGMRGFLTPHYHHFVAKVLIALYRGRGASAWSTVTSEWPRLRLGLFLSYEPIRCELFALRGRAAAAALVEAESGVAGASAVRRLAREVERAAAELERHDLPLCAPQASALRATLFACRGDRTRAAHELEQAERGFAAAGMSLSAACVRLRLEEWAATVADRGERAAAMSWMRARGVTRPDAIARIYVPIGPAPATALSPGRG